MYFHLERNFELRDVNTIRIIIFSTVIKQKFIFFNRKELKFQFSEGFICHFNLNQGESMANGRITSAKLYYEWAFVYLA